MFYGKTNGAHSEKQSRSPKGSAKHSLETATINYGTPIQLGRFV